LSDEIAMPEREPTFRDARGPKFPGLTFGSTRSNRWMHPSFNRVQQATRFESGERRRKRELVHQLKVRQAALASVSQSPPHADGSTLPRSPWKEHPCWP